MLASDHSLKSVDLAGHLAHYLKSALFRSPIPRCHGSEMRAPCLI